jgi:hypothetical protein
VLKKKRQREEEEEEGKNGPKIARYHTFSHTPPVSLFPCAAATRSLAPQLGYVAGDANGAGPEILRTTDGGLTFNSTQVWCRIASVVVRAIV